MESESKFLHVRWLGRKQWGCRVDGQQRSGFGTPAEAAKAASQLCGLSLKQLTKELPPPTPPEPRGCKRKQASNSPKSRPSGYKGVYNLADGRVRAKAGQEHIGDFRSPRAAAVALADHLNKTKASGGRMATLSSIRGRGPKSKVDDSAEAEDSLAAVTAPVVKCCRCDGDRSRRTGSEFSSLSQQESL